MAIPAGVYRVVFGGTLFGGEVWESGFWVQGAVPTSNSVANACAQLWWGQLTATDGSGGVTITKTSLWNGTISMTYAKVYCYPTGGPAATYIGTYSGTPVTGSGTGSLPNQCCLVASLRTGTAGRRYRGRMYLPIGVLGSGVGGQITGAVATTVATGWSTCFSDWNASGDNGKVVVVSTAGGVATEIDLVQVDTRLDVQRRRARSEAVTAVAAVPVTGL